MPRKGLGRKGVCLLQHYCPFCFKGKIGVSCGLYVDASNPLVNKTQAWHASKGNGLNLLDFTSPGDFCENTDLCKLVCLVCGKATIDGTDEDFQLFYDFFGREEEECPLVLKYEIHDVMERLNLKWTEQWDTPIHAKCSKKQACICVAPPTRASASTAAGKQQPKQQQQAHSPPSTHQPQTKLLPVQETPRASLVSMKKADWLPPATTSANAVNYNPPPDSKGKKMAMMPHPAKKPLPPPKPTIKTIQLLAAANKCAFKIEQWTGLHPTNAKLAAGQTINGEASGIGSVTSKEKQYSLKEHNERFDPAIHGPCMVNGVLGYRLVNMKFVPTTSNVNTLNEDGTLTPLTFY